MEPYISFVIPMKEQDFRVILLLKSIREQNYPQNRIEIIIIDGGSNPAVLKECKKYNVKIYINIKKKAEGAGMGKDQGIWKSSGDFIVIAESDIELIGKNWINNMLKPFKEDSEIFASVPRLYANQKDNISNRYLSYVGVDPFAIFRSIEGQYELNSKIAKIKKSGYSILKLDNNNPYCMGSNGFMFKKDLIKKVGDYAQDVEFIARLALNNYKKFAVVENAKVWHKNVKNLNDFIKKRVKWTINYTLPKFTNKEKYEFIWINDKLMFFVFILKNLLFFPNIPISLKKFYTYRDSAWLLHAPFLLISTLFNIFFAITSKTMIKKIIRSY